MRDAFLRVGGRQSPNRCVALDLNTQIVKLETAAESWSRNFGPVVKVDRMMREVIQNEETKEPFA
jgi:hypothetical protein